MTFSLCLLAVTVDLNLIATVKVWERLKPKHPDYAKIECLERELGLGRAR